MKSWDEIMNPCDLCHHLWVSICGGGWGCITLGLEKKQGPVLQPHVPGQVTSMPAKLMCPGAGFSPKHTVYPQPLITRPFFECVCAESVMV